MHTRSTALWKHDHTFGQEQIKVGEKGTRLVIMITGVMMIVEIVAGIVFGSMALLADGIHMGSHAAALGISAAAYMYARRYASDRWVLSGKPSGCCWTSRRLRKFEK
jgi:Co/Zn/Cd efflux system component